MASTSQSLAREQRQTSQEIYTLHEMFHVVGDQLTARDVKWLKCLFNDTLSDEMMSKITDGFTFLLALERLGKIDDSNFRYLTRLLRIISRLDLIQFVTLKRRKTVSPDPVDEFLERTAKSRIIVPFKRKRLDCAATPYGGTSGAESMGVDSSVLHENSLEVGSSGVSSNFDLESQPSTSGLSSNTRVTSGDRNDQCSNVVGAVPSTSEQTHSRDSFASSPASKQRKTIRKRKSGRAAAVRDAASSSTGTCTAAVPDRQSATMDEIKRKVTCDIRLRVRAEYCNHESALQGNIHSNKPELLERQFERFFQANTILKSRDLGSIICDIKFSELTYLDAFWRDYINGSLLEALKGVFITDSLKQAVGHEAIKLLVNVDEDDYIAGRVKLLHNLTD